VSPGAALDLRDIHLPPAPGWWPPAPGWWLLAVLLAVLVLLLVRALQRQRRLRRQRRRLRDELAALRLVHAGADDGAVLLAALSQLLRRACKQHAPAALNLQGEDWLRFLDHGLPQAPFSTGVGRLLLDGPFRRHIDPAAAQAVFELVEQRLLALPGARR
jgi:hypothetical protein